LAGFQVFFGLFNSQGAQDDRVHLRPAEQPLKREVDQGFPGGARVSASSSTEAK
jgi:hypothetical protein